MTFIGHPTMSLKSFYNAKNSPDGSVIPRAVMVRLWRFFEIMESLPTAETLTAARISLRRRARTRILSPIHHSVSRLISLSVRWQRRSTRSVSLFGLRSWKGNIGGRFSNQVLCELSMFSQSVSHSLSRLGLWRSRGWFGSRATAASLPLNGSDQSINIIIVTRRTNHEESKI